MNRKNVKKSIRAQKEEKEQRKKKKRKVEET